MTWESTRGSHGDGGLGYRTRALMVYTYYNVTTAGELLTLVAQWLHYSRKYKVLALWALFFKSV